MPLAIDQNVIQAVQLGARTSIERVGNNDCPTLVSGETMSDGKVLKERGADAVRIEPVSTDKFPGNREKNREFRGKGPLLRFCPIGKPIQ
jgi:hypothetical protein